jgi:transketolase
MSNNHLPLGNTNLDVFAKTLMELAETDRDLLLVTSDSRGSGRVTPFGDKFPDQIVEIGIAEQNLVGISAGLASAGKKVFAISPACFLTARALEQIKNDVAYSDHPVKLIGISAGVSYGSLGSTHHSLHDYAALQAINNIDIVAPADNFETVRAIECALNHPRPIYIRFGKKPMPHLHPAGAQFAIGKAIQLTPTRDHYDVAMIGIGETVYQAYVAAQALEEEGIHVCVISMHSLRPFDEQMVEQVARCSEAIVTVEEHSVNGGLGSRVASFLMQAEIFRPLRIVGIPDEHTVTGSQAEIFNHYGISADGLTATAKKLLKRVSA